MKKSLVLLALGVSVHAYATPITWIGTSSNDLNLASNWDPATVPTTGDDAIFNSTIPGVNTSPVGQGADFLSATFQFPVKASPFNISILNRQLIFDGIGITGNNTDATITATNTDTTYTVINQIYFNGPSGTSGSAHLDLTNTSSIVGAPGSSVFLSVINHHVHSPNAFSMGNNGTLTAKNIGQDSSSGTGFNISAGVFQGQVELENTALLGDKVNIQISNEGTNTASSIGNLVGYVLEWQLNCSDAFVAGDDLNVIIANTGTDTSIGFGGGQSGTIGSAGSNGRQIELASCTVGNNAGFTITNSGNISSNNTSSGCRAGTTLGDQGRFHGAFTAGNDFGMSVTNVGNDSGQGVGGNNAGVVGGVQIAFEDTFNAGSNSVISVVSNGNNSGTASGPPNSTGFVSGGQLASVGSFQMGNDANLTVSNEGSDSSSGNGNNFVGFLGLSQARFFDALTFGNDASLSFSNSGANSGNAAVSGNIVGVLQQGSQLDAEGSFLAGDRLDLNVSNIGFDSSTGVGLNNVGAILSPTPNASQALFNNNVTLGNKADIEIFNLGIRTGTSTVQQNKIGYSNKEQLYVAGTFETGDDLFLTVDNVGISIATGAAIDEIGVVASGNQANFRQAVQLGDNAVIGVSNAGLYVGSNPSNTYVGYVFGKQLVFGDQLIAGDNFRLEVSNAGIASTLGNDKYVGFNAGQVQFDQDCTLGNDAFIHIGNLGSNSSTGMNNYVGYVINNQITCTGTFTAGKTLRFLVDNFAENTGNPSNHVGQIAGSQLDFVAAPNFSDDALIIVNNTGTVDGSQLVFENGFNVTSGKATFRVSNSGTVAGQGIYVLGNAPGGNADIILENSSLYVDTTFPTFTINSLSGDSRSTAEVRPEFIIDTDVATSADFAGTIKDFPSTVSRLTKQGPGTQKLSGINTYTGLTNVNEGTLILTGSVVGDVIVNLQGTLKGTGTIGNNLINYGTVAPGESIGTLTVLGNYINNNGIYDVEVDGSPKSDLIDVTGVARLNGGTVVVSSTDGSFKFLQPYTIVEADGGVVGTYTGATSLAFVRPTLTYDPNHVYLTLRSDLLRAAESCNQLGVASVLDHILNLSTNQTNLISAIASLPLKEAQKALESLSGFQYTSDIWESNISMQRFLRRLYNPLRALVTNCNPNPCSAWLEIGDAYTHIHNTSVNSYDITGGLQNEFCHNITIGLGGSYEYDHIDYKHAEADWDTGYLALYGLYRPCSFYVLADLVYGYSSSAFNRTMHAGSFHYRAESTPHISSFSFYGEAGKDFEYGCAKIQPFLGIQAGTSKRSHVKEKSSDDFALSLKKQEWDAVALRLGVHASTCNLCKNIDASFDVAWNHYFSEGNNRTKGRFTDFGDEFRICGDSFDRNSVDYAVNFATNHCGNYKGYLELGGEIWEHAYTFNISAGVEFSW